MSVKQMNDARVDDVLFEISKISSMMSNNERAKLWTKSKFSLCDRFKSLSSVNSVIPIIPFIGVLHPIPYQPPVSTYTTSTKTRT